MNKSMLVLSLSVLASVSVALAPRLARAETTTVELRRLQSQITELRAQLEALEARRNSGAWVCTAYCPGMGSDHPRVATALKAVDAFRLMQHEAPCYGLYVILGRSNTPATIQNACFLDPNATALSEESRDPRAVALATEAVPTGKSSNAPGATAIE